MSAVRVLLLASVLAAAVSPAQEIEGVGQFSGALETEFPPWFKESFLEFEDDIDEAAAEGKRLMLFFHQNGCPYCNALVERNFAEADIARTVRETLEVVAINMWGDLEVVHVGGVPYTEKTLAEDLRVNYTPTLLFFTEDHQVALRLDGYYPPAEFRHALAYVNGHKETELSFREYLDDMAPTGSEGSLHDEEFFLPPPFDLNRTREPADRPLAVFFEQGGCEACDLLHQSTLADPSTRELIERFAAVQLDLHADTPVVTPRGQATTARAWAHELGVQFAPTIVFFDRAGLEVMRTEAMFRTFHLQSAFDYVLTQEYEAQPNFQRYLSDRADRLIEQGVDVDIWRY